MPGSPGSSGVLSARLVLWQEAATASAMASPPGREAGGREGGPDDSAPGESEEIKYKIKYNGPGRFRAWGN